ncbi:MAG: hypothetical protein ISR87_13195 [Candidatus Marinimicrobia bacterium]|nr:hypothetical protein [FCB group bacterium]MBL7026397.1 hypothetical protein [Candidatus Neomarinimicrobiota bacterium]
MDRKQAYTIALLSFSLLSLELIWTRILAAEFFYTFAFLVLSLAILGLGLGALTLRIIPKVDTMSSMRNSLLLGGVMIFIGPPLVYRLGMSFSALTSSLAMLGKLGLVIFILSSSFYFCGIALAILFKRFHSQISELYMADLIGAGLGVVGAIICMNLFGTPVATFLISIPIFLAAMLFSERLLKLIPGLLILISIGAGYYGSDLLKSSKPERFPSIYQHWDAMAQIKMFAYPGDEARGMVIDNAANTPVYGFDGDYALSDSGSEDLWGIPAGDLIRQFDSCRFLSLGAGGGADVLQALAEGATEVHAVEVNPWFNKMLTEGDPQGYLSAYTDTLTSDLVTLPEFTSHFYQDPRVIVVSEDARAFIRRHTSRFDVIYSLSSNTFAALASGSFALAENYLFTTEAFQDYWTALSDSGYLMMEHQFYMPRLASEALIALDNLGVKQPKSHIAVYNLPNMRRKVLLMSKRPLETDFLQIALRDITKENYDDVHLVYPAVDSLKDNIYQKIVDLGWEEVADSLSIDISPNNDNRPFAAQMGLWKNLSFGGEDRLLPYEFRGFPLTKLIVVIIILVILVFIFPLTLIPYLKSGPSLSLNNYAYFALIGFAYMAVELILMQQFTLLVGPSVYSVAAILMTLLISSGIGSRYSSTFESKIVFVAIISWLFLDIVLFRYIVYLFGDFGQVIRILATVVLVSPLGFFMGMPFPKGVRHVGPLVDWGFAVNGAASVLGSTLTILLVISWGYAIGLGVALLLYGGAGLLIQSNSSS